MLCINLALCPALRGTGFVVGVTCIAHAGSRVLPSFLCFLTYLFASNLIFCKLLFFFLSGGREDREQWTHQPEGGRAGWLSGAIQDQKAHSSQQTDESLLWTAGEAATQFILLLKISYLQMYCNAGSLNRGKSSWRPEIQLGDPWCSSQMTIPYYVLLLIAYQ